MANRDRNDRSAQQEIFRGIDESRGSLLNSEGGKRGSDVGNTQPLVRTEEEGEGKRPPKPPRHKNA